MSEQSWPGDSPHSAPSPISPQPTQDSLVRGVAQHSFLRHTESICHLPVYPFISSFAPQEAVECQFCACSIQGCTCKQNPRDLGSWFVRKTSYNHCSGACQSQVSSNKLHTWRGPQLSKAAPQPTSNLTQRGSASKGEPQLQQTGS